MTETLDLYRKDVERVVDLTQLENDPFPLIPPSEVDYWADNKILLNSIKEALLDSLLFASSNIYLFWGKVGVGKTFAANYLCGPKGFSLFLEELPNNLIKDQKSIVVRAPTPRRSGELLSRVYIDIINKLINIIIEDSDLRSSLIRVVDELNTSNIKRAFRDISNTLKSRRMDGGSIPLEESDGYKFIADERNKYGKLRDINDLGEVVRILSLVILSKYEKLSIIIDELEHLGRAPIAEKYQFNDFIKCLFQKIDVNMNLILIYTFDTYGEVETLFTNPVKDRIKQVIPFTLVNNEADLYEYIHDCLEKRGKIKPTDFIDEEVITKLSKKIIERFGQLSFRDINKEMHRFMALCFRARIEDQDFDITKFRISNELFDLLYR